MKIFALLLAGFGLGRHVAGVDVVLENHGDAGQRLSSPSLTAFAIVVVIALVSFFSIVVTTLAGLAAVDPELPKLMRTFDASRTRVFRLVELPAADQCSSTR